MAKSISDLLESRQTDLMSHPHLIIDLRGNGGGADYSFYPLVPHIYTNPMKVAGEDFWASPENAEHLRVFLKESDFPEEYHKGMQDLIERMEAEPNTFVTGAPDQTIEIEDILDHPERIGILIDEKCASSTEEFLLMAAQSKKVTLIGSNTRGSLDYSNLRNIELPSGKYVLRMPMSRSRRLPDHPIDGTGIEPDIRIPDSENDPVAFASHCLRQSNEE